MGHSYAVLADWLTLAAEFPEPDKRLACLLEAVDYMAETALRQPVFEYTNERIPYTEEGFLHAVEKEQEEQAVAMILQALSNGIHYTDVERSLTQRH